MDFDIDSDFSIFDSLLKKRPEINVEAFKKELKDYYLPYVDKLIALKKDSTRTKGIIVGVSAIQGAGKTTQGEILEVLLNHMKHSTISLSIDDHYLPHQDLVKLRNSDPRYIRRGVTHDIELAIKNLTDLANMQNGQTVKIPIYDKGAEGGDGDRVGWKDISEKPDFIFYDGWMLGARKYEDESIFESGLPALDTPEHIQFAKDINKKLLSYYPLWDLIDFLTVLYVLDYSISLKWRDQAEEALRAQGKGMSPDQIREFVYYFWRSVHPAVHIKSLALDSNHTNQVVIINNDHSLKEVLSPSDLKSKYT